MRKSGAIKVDGHKTMYIMNLDGHPNGVGEWLLDEIEKERPVTELLNEHPRFNCYFKTSIPDYIYKITEDDELLVRENVEFDWKPIRQLRHD